MTNEKNNELMQVEVQSALIAFSQDGGLASVIQQAKDTVKEFKHDMTTKASRARTASIANKVSKLKVKLDSMGKDLVSDWKSKAKAVDANRKMMRDELDDLKSEARKPLSDWEADQKIIEEEKKELDRISRIDADFDFAFLMMTTELKEREEIALAEEAAEIERLRSIELDRIERENVAILAAKEEAKVTAERHAQIEINRVEAEKQRAINDKLIAERFAEKQKQDLIKANIDAEEKRKQAILDAEIATKEAVEAEKQKQKLIKKQRDDEEKARAENIAHVTNVCSKVKDDLMNNAGICEQDAIKVVMAIRSSKVRFTSIKF